MVKPETEIKSIWFESPCIKPLYYTASPHKQEKAKQNENPHYYFKTNTLSCIFLKDGYMQTMAIWSVSEV